MKIGGPRDYEWRKETKDRGKQVAKADFKWTKDLGEMEDGPDYDEFTIDLGKQAEMEDGPDYKWTKDLGEMEDGPDYKWTKDLGEMENGPDFKWTDAEYKRASAWRSVDFRRFSAMRNFDRQMVAPNMSRMEYALQVSKRIQDDLPDPLMMIEDVPDTKKMKIKMESFDPDGPYMREEIHRRIKWAYDLHMKDIKGKKKEEASDDDDDKDGEAMNQEFVRRIMWSSELTKKCGPAASDAAARLLTQAVHSTVFSPLF